ncbi:MAG: cobalamin-binding protein [Pirellulaceae bacterium]
MRIVSLISSATEILFALGLGGQVVAVSHECDFPAAANRLPRATRSRIDSSRPSGEIDDQVKSLSLAGGPLYEIDGELLAGLAPDLIVTQSQCDVCAVRYADVLDLVQTVPSLRAARVLALNPQSLEEVLTDVCRVAQAAGAASLGDRLASALRARIEAVASQTARLSEAERPSVVCIEWTEPLMAAGNWTPRLIELAGGISGLAVAGRHSGYITWEAIRQFDPDVLLVAPCGFDLTRSVQEAAALTSLPGFAELNAVKCGRAFVIDGNAYLNRSGPRLVDSLEILAHLIQPQLFPRPPLDAAWRPLAFPDPGPP